jgi:hypothetical protein
MIFEGHAIKEMLMFYSTLVGPNMSQEEEYLLFEELKNAIIKIDPVMNLGNSMTSYEAFLMASGMDIQKGNVMIATLDDVEGYIDTCMEYTPWDPLIPVDDTQQYPDDECVERSLEPCMPCSLPAREEHGASDFFQGKEIVGLLTEEFQDVSIFDENNPTNDTDQFPNEDNVSTMDRTIFSTEYARRDFA